MGEIRIKSRNLFDLENYIAKAVYIHNIEVTPISNGISIISTSSVDPYINPSYNIVGQQITTPSVKRALINCKSNTAYTLYFQQSQNVTKRISYFNSEFTVVKGYDSFNGSIFNITTPDDCVYILIRIGDSATMPEGTSIELTNIQLLEGTYTAETIPEYQPYFLNRPAHQYINGEWIDIPTHKFINGRWQGELTSQSPLKFRADGEMLDWRVEGRTSKNLALWDKQWLINTNGVVEYDKNVWASIIDVHDVNTIYLSGDVTKLNNSTYRIGGFTEYPELGVVGIRSTNAGGVINVTDYNFCLVSCSLYNMPTTKQDLLDEFMITLGSTQPTEFEPYGGVGDWDETEQKYKIPVTVNGTTTNLYTDHQLMDGDSIDFTTDQTTIPIATGNNTLTVDTAVKPKSVFVKFEG